MSEKTEKWFPKALEDYKNGKTRMVDNLDNYLSNL